ncbi:MAG: YtxH domain-containing protein [Thermoanaerobacteraceae bacterium]|uniref:YtxH domain-containing protein n=1 Tax=Thermanaeromonas sp. C210 TaxID=2731925 RepID=UPI0015660E15|nr:YtxH domain-containing protein [Thermanaeromonas sp. C210]MBE3581173.1 YtxH domain-containing protein [Thermoanaerobacteraceae bacterium]
MLRRGFWGGLLAGAVVGFFVGLMSHPAQSAEEPRPPADAASGTEDGRPRRLGGVVRYRRN